MPKSGMNEEAHGGEVECPQCGYAIGGEVEQDDENDFNPQDDDLKEEDQREERHRAFATALRRRK